MFLGIGTDSSGFPALTANYPYPNLKCTVKLKCDTGGSLSSDIIAVSYDPNNTWAQNSSNNILVSSLA